MVDNQSGKITEKALWRSVFLTFWHCILNADSTKTHFTRVTLNNTNYRKTHFTPSTVSPERTRKSIAQLSFDWFLWKITIIICNYGIVRHTCDHTKSISMATRTRTLNKKIDWRSVKKSIVYPCGHRRPMDVARTSLGRRDIQRTSKDVHGTFCAYRDQHIKANNLPTELPHQ